MRCYPESKKAIEFTVKLPGDVNQYALNFLHIFNNVRENPDVLCNLKNYDGTNLISVVCDMDYENEAEAYLSQFGEITEKEYVYLIRVAVDVDYNMLDGDISNIAIVAVDEY